MLYHIVKNNIFQEKGSFAMQKVWFITGAAKGIGNAVANEVLKAGNCVVATTRKENDFVVPQEYRKNVLTLTLDVSNTNEEIYNNVVNAAVKKFDRIDVLVNNAGFGAITNFEETSEEAIRRLFEVNVFGLMRVTRAVLPIMRQQRSGHIFNIASGAGYCAGPVPYHTSKFAVTGFSTSLAFEVAPFGIKVTNVAPGLFRTGFYDKEKWGTVPDIHIADYDTCRWQTDFIKNAEQHKQPGNPVKLAELLLEVETSQNPPLHLAVGADTPEVIDNLCTKLKEDTDKWRDKAINTSFDK